MRCFLYSINSSKGNLQQSIFPRLHSVGVDGEAQCSLGTMDKVTGGKMGGGQIPGNIWEKNTVHPCMSLFNGRVRLKTALVMLLKVCEE